MKPVIGLDIGTHYTKAVKVVSIEPVKIERVYVFETPRTIIEEEEKIDKKEVANKIKEKLGKEVEKCRIVTSLPANLIRSTHLTLPSLSKKELEEVAIREAQGRMVPTPAPDSAFEYLVLEKGEKYKVFVACTQKKNVDEIISLLEDLKTPSIITFSSYAHLKAVSTYESELPEFGFAELGRENSTISIIKQNKLQMFRTLHPLCPSLISSICEKFNLSVEEAQEKLVKYGLPKVGIDFDTPQEEIKEKLNNKSEEEQQGKETEEINLLEFRLLVQKCLKRAVKEIKRTMIYYREQYGGNIIKKLYLDGGVSALKNFEEYFSVNLNTDIEVFDPFKNVKLEEGELEEELEELPSPIFSTALGLCLQEEEKTIDFTPKELKKIDVSWIVRYVNIILISLLSVGILIVGLWQIRLSKINVKNRLSNKKYQKRLDMFKSYLEKEKKISKRKQKLRSKISKINKIAKNRPNWQKLLKKMSKKLPPEVILNEVAVRKSSTGKIKADMDKDITKLKKMEGVVGGERMGEASGRRSQTQQQSSYWMIIFKGYIKGRFRTCQEIFKKLESNFSKSNTFKIKNLSPIRLGKISIPELSKEEAKKVHLTEVKKRTIRGILKINLDFPKSGNKKRFQEKILQSN